MVARDHRRDGLVAGAAAYLLWGLLPIYLKAVKHVPSEDVLAYRILWSLVLCGLIASLFRGLPGTWAVLRDRRRLGLLAVSALAIAINWLIYIWAIAHDHVIEASLGYFINPLISVLFGVVLLDERLDRAGWLAVALAAAGVAVLTIGQGALPWISLGLAFSFATYGLIRKHVPVEPVVGLLIETLILAPVAMLWIAIHGHASFGRDLTTGLLLVAAGPVTAVPLMLFAFAAQRLPLTTIGLMQYGAPTLAFLLGVFVYHEPLGWPQLVAFGCIWAGLAIFAAGGIHQARRRALAQAAALR